MHDGNSKVEDAMIDVAIDNGYADQKICFWDAPKKKIISMSLPSRAQMGAMCMDASGHHVGVYDIDGTGWTVGANVTDPEKIRKKNYAHSELNTVLVNHSLMSAGFSGKTVRLATGLPFSHFFNDEGMDKEFIGKVKAALKVPVTSRDGKVMPIIAKHVVTPESTAAWLDFSMDNNCKSTIGDFNRAAVIDIGGNTTDVSYINGGDGGSTINSAKSGTRDIGVLNVRDQLCVEIMKSQKVQSVGESELDRALRTGEIKLYGTMVSVADELKRAKKLVLARLDNFISEKVGDASDLDFIVFVGGGAAVLHDVIAEYGKNARIPPDPEFANARGMLKFLRMNSK